MTNIFIRSAISAILTCLVFGTLHAQVIRVETESKPMAGDSPSAVVLLPTWMVWGSVQSGFGFRDNVLLSHEGEERSGFARGGFDATVWRAPLQGMDYLASLKAEGTRYFSATTVDQEAEAILLAEWRYVIGRSIKTWIDVRGFYFDQVYDASDTDLQRVVAEVKTLGASTGPRLKWMFRPAWWVEGQADHKRLTYRDGLNNRTVREGAVRLGWQPGSRWEVSLAGTEGRRNYNVREQNSVSGRPLAGTLLKVAEREAEFRIDATLDAHGHWKTATRLSALRFRDNGHGYLNYHQRKLTHEVGWTTPAWFVEFTGSVRRLDFGLQSVGVGISPDRLMRNDVSVGLLIERKLSPRWTAFAEYTWERNRSNDVIASYILNEGLLGVRWNWEK